MLRKCTNIVAFLLFRSFYGTCNQKSLEIDYTKCNTYKDDRVKQTVNILLAFLNSKHGGILTLVNTNQAKTTSNGQCFDVKLVNMLGPGGVNVLDHIVTLGNMYEAERYFFVKPVDEDVVFSPIISYCHDRIMNRTEEKKRSDDIHAILHRPMDEIPTLPDHGTFVYGKHHKGLAECDQIEFKCPQEQIADNQWKKIYDRLRGLIQDLVSKKQTGHVICGLQKKGGNDRSTTDDADKYVIFGIPLSDKHKDQRKENILTDLKAKFCNGAKNKKFNSEFEFDVSFKHVERYLYILVVSVKCKNTENISPILHHDQSTKLGKIYKPAVEEKVVDFDDHVYQLSKAAKLDTDAIHENLNALISQETSGFLVYGFVKVQNTPAEGQHQIIGIPVLDEKNCIDVITKLTFTVHGIPKASFQKKDENGYFHLQAQNKQTDICNMRLKITFLPVSPAELVNKVIILSLDCGGTLPESGFGLIDDASQILEYKQAYEPDRGLTCPVNFVYSARNVVTEQFERDYERYVPAFANNRGGHLIFGIEDDGNIVGYHDIMDEEEYKKTLQKKIQKRLHVFQIKEETCDRHKQNTLAHNFHCEYHSKHDARNVVQPEIKFIPVGKSPSGFEKKIVVVSVKRLVNGIVCTQLPEIPVWQMDSQEYLFLDSEECCHVLQDLYEKGMY